MAWQKEPSPEDVGRAVLDVSGAAGLGVVLALVGAFLLWRAGSRLELTWLGAWAVAPFVLALFMTAVTPVFLDRYLIVAAPAFALLGGVALVHAERWLRVVLATAVVLACCAGLVHWYSLGKDGNWRGEDWRSAVSALEQRSGSGAVVVSPWWANLAPRYYGAEPAQAASTGSTWVLTWSETGHRLTEEELLQLGLAQHRLVEREEFGRRVSLQHWVRSG
jgi:mannosyltransferase